MIIAKAILQIYPSAVPLKDFIVQDDGAGPYIAHWSYSEPQPTQEELETAWAAVENAPPPKTEVELLREENEQLNLSIIELWESIIPLLP